MNRFILSGGLAVIAATPAVAGINATDASGYLDRAVKMIGTRDYEGALDQLNHLTLLSPDPTITEQAQYYTAVAVQGLGDDDALQLFRAFLEQYPASPRRQLALMAVGDYYFTRAAYADALNAYNEVDAGALNDAAADDYLYRVAYCYMLLGEYDDAERLFKRLLSSPTYSNAAAYYMAYLEYARGNYDTALKLFKNVNTTCAPGNAAPYYISQIYFSRGDYSNALSIAERLLKEGPLPEYESECNRLVGESLYNMGREDQGLPYLWKYAAATKDPAPSAFYILGMSEYRNGNIDNAIKLLQRAIGSDDAMGQSAYLTLGQAYQRRGDSSAALMAFERASRMNFDPRLSEAAAYNYAVARLEGGRIPFGSSVDMFEDFLRKYPDSPYAAKVQEYVVNGYMTDNDYESALAALNRIAEPNDALLAAKQRILFMLGTRQYSAGKVTDASRSFNEAASLSRFNEDIAVQCMMWQGDCAYRLGDYDEAAQYYRKYIDNTPSGDTSSRMLAWYDLGYARMGQQRYSDALTDFIRVIDSKAAIPANMRADALNRAGDCKYYMSEFSDASDYYRRAFDSNPDAGDYALFQLAMMKGFSRDYQGKIATIDRLTSSFPSSGLLPAALLEKADSYVSLGNNAGAIAVYNTLIDNYPGTSQGRNGMLRLAITQLNSGSRADAIKTYKRLVKTYPSSEEARLATDDLKRIYAADGKLDELVSFLKSVNGAPSIDAIELDDLTFRAAEADYINTGSTARLKSYLETYPQGTNAAVAQYYFIEDAWNEGDAARAIKLADELLKTFPDTEAAEDALEIRAEALSSTGKKDAALKTWQALEERASEASTLQTARLGIIRTATETGRNETVVATADKMLSSTAGSPDIVTEVKFYRGIALNNLHRYSEGEKQLEEIADNTDDLYGAQAAYELAQSLYDRGKTSRAKTLINKFINANPPHRYWLARGFILYSDILRSEGNTFEADEYLKSLRSNYPGSESDIFTLINQRLK